MDDVRMMFRFLEAGGPCADHADELMLFGQFVGSWDLDIKAFDGDGVARTFAGEWHFGWALEGRAVQDVLITRSLQGEVVGFGSTVRSFDPKRDLWWIVWQDPLAGEFSVLLARAEGDRIVLEGQWTIGDPPQHFRWTFSDITADSFHWEGHLLDGGGRWQLAEAMHARRFSHS